MNFQKFSLAYTSAIFGLISFFMITNGTGVEMQQFLFYYLRIFPALGLAILILWFLKPENTMTSFIFILLSSMIYHICGWLAIGPLAIPYSFAFAGFIGACLLLAVTKFILDKNFPLISIVIAGLLGGLSFLPQYLFYNSFGTALSLFLWTFLIGSAINIFKLRNG